MQSTKTDGPSNDNVPSLNHQCLYTLQWPYTPQHGVQQPPFMPRPFIATQSPFPGILNQWPQFPHLQQNPSNHQAQQGQQPRNYSQSAAPLWLPQRAGYTLPGLNAQATFQPFVAFGATDTSWQTPAAVGGGTSTANQAQAPNFCYPVGPGFPGPCDLAWWGQAQQPLCTYAYPGGYFPSSASSLPDCTAPVGQTSRKGIIRPSAKLSQQHQQLWDAQSAENVQLWSVVNHLQSEIVDYKNRLVKLEAEVSSLKPAAEEPTAEVSGVVLSRQPSKRGRPKRSVASAVGLPAPDESHCRARKPAACKGNQKPPLQSFEEISETSQRCSKPRQYKVIGTLGQEGLTLLNKLLSQVEVAIIIISIGGKALFFGHRSVHSLFNKLLPGNPDAGTSHDEAVGQEPGLQDLNKNHYNLLEQVELENKRGKKLRQTIKEKPKAAWLHAPRDSLSSPEELYKIKGALEKVKEKARKDKEMLLAQPSSSWTKNSTELSDQS